MRPVRTRVGGFDEESGGGVIYGSVCSGIEAASIAWVCRLAIEYFNAYPEPGDVKRTFDRMKP